jgi:hypothetical protein
LQAALDTLLSAVPPRGKKTRADWSDSNQADWSDSKFQRDARCARPAVDHPHCHGVMADYAIGRALRDPLANPPYVR